VDAAEAVKEFVGVVDSGIGQQLSGLLALA
jgi:hypothetical protein